VNPIDNHSLADAAELVFANSPAYVVELPMVGREQEAKQLLDVLVDVEHSGLVSISAPLGAGKTFFLSTIFGQLTRRLEGFDERQDRVVVLATDMVTPDELGTDVGPDDIGSTKVAQVLDPAKLFGERPGRKVLVIEELDRKATLAQVKWALAAGLSWLSTSKDHVLIVTGDATITGLHSRAFLDTVPSRKEISLGPLDLDLLKLAISRRLVEKVLKPKNPDGEIEELIETADRAANEVLADDYIRWSAVPLTAPPMLATFRDALGVLRVFAQNSPSHHGSVELKRDLIEVMPEHRGGLPPSAAALERALRDGAKRAILGDVALEAYSVADLAGLVGLSGSPEFAHRTVRVLTRKGLLVPMGTPYDEENEYGIPVALSGPYMPSYRLVHNTLLDLVRGSE
jgi:hypothetical protein